MGTVGRNIFLVIPFLLSLVATILLIIVMLDQHSSDNSFLTSLYFLRINTYDLNVDANVAGQNVNLPIGKSGLTAAYYQIGLQNYCSGPDAKVGPNYCSKPVPAYYFNPLEVWNLENSPIKSLVPQAWEKSLNTYHEASKFMFAAYVVALVASILTLIFGIASFFLSRITSILTWICADIAALFTAMASAAATAIFTIVAGVINAQLHKDGVTTDFGSKLLAVTWLATAFSIAAGLFWSCGCCCGRSASRKDNKRSRSLKGRSNYERLDSPFKVEGHHEDGYGQPVPLYGQPQHQHPGPMGAAMPGQQTGVAHHTAYEPYRQV